MSETPRVPHFESAEQKYFIDTESGYFKAISFAKDPVDYFVAFKQTLREDEFEEADFGLQAMGELAELEQIIENEELPVLDERVLRMLAAEYYSEAWAIAVFSIFKDAGFTKEQFVTWFEASDDELTPEEKFKERTMMVYLNKVYSQV
jgi:hypothetical protein